MNEGQGLELASSVNPALPKTMNACKDKMHMWATESLFYIVVA